MCSEKLSVQNCDSTCSKKILDHTNTLIPNEPYEIIVSVEEILGFFFPTPQTRTEINFKGRKKYLLYLSKNPFLKHLKGFNRNKVLIELSWSKTINAKLKPCYCTQDSSDVCFTIVPQDNDILLVFGFMCVLASDCP